MNAWLPHIGKSNSPSFPQCGHHTQDGDHIVWHCPALQEERSRLGLATRWEGIDRPIYISSEGGQDEWDAVEEFFFMRRLLH